VLDLVFSRTAGVLGSSQGGAGFSGTPGILRMFNSQLGGEIAWLIPLGLAGLVGGLLVTMRARRTDLSRAGYLMWGMWALLYFGVLSTATGVVHPYYTVVMAPALAALAGGGSVALWRLGRARRWLAWMLPAAVLGTALLSASLLRRTAGYAPGLATVVTVAGAAGALGLVIVIARLVKAKTVAFAVATAGLVAVLAGPAAYVGSTISKSVTGSFASAGPTATTQLASRGADGGMGGQGGQGGGAGTEDSVSTALISYLEANEGTAKYLVAVQGSSSGEGIILATGQPVMVMGGFSGSDPAPTLAQFEQMVAAGEVRYVLVSNQNSGGGGFGGGSAQPASTESSGTTATTGSASASAALLQSGPPSGGPSGQEGMPGGNSGSDMSAIMQWVASHGTAVDTSAYGGSSAGGTLYLLDASQVSS
jgi:4-amino-4-deoxy-L-arabinose transferase-like glycosyltransferase